MADRVMKMVESARYKTCGAADHDRICLIMSTACFADAKLKFDNLVIDVSKAEMRGERGSKQLDAKQRTLDTVFASISVLTAAHKEVPADRSSQLRQMVARKAQVSHRG